MNLELLESFGQNFPEEPDGVLDSISLAVTASFNKYGTLLAVGCNDGRLVVWDFMTRGISKVMYIHIHPVCSVCWSRDGRKILTASTDNTVCIIDILTGDIEHRYRFPSPILKIQYNPRSLGNFLVCPMRYSAMIVSLDGSRLEIPLDDPTDPYIVSCFDRKGQHVFTGNTKGKVTAYRSSDAVLVASFQLFQTGITSISVKSIEFARRGDSFVVNSSDRIIRVYDTNQVLACGIDGDPEPAQKLQDLVNKTMWKKCVFSGDGEYVCGGSSRQHALYIWDKSNGNLVKILHGTKGELLLDLMWHPVRPIICSISSGVISVWAQNQVENWSAFAPDFKELDENVEYDERESEFDEEDEDKIVENQNANADDDQEVDVCTIEPIAAYCSSDEEDNINALLHLPIAPDVDIAEEVWIPPPDVYQAAQEDYHNAKKQVYPELYKENSLIPHHKKKKAKTYDIPLDGSPIDDVHPLLSNKPLKEKHIYKRSLSGSSSGSSIPRMHKSESKKQRRQE